ncbi:MAG: succinyl-diaminopimelate desuccinylase [Alphaproteobacteria bacterium]|nr:MAG: succinyl-diaminopimelate desuccinylase [Alphaproteobacteria bacterium]
MHFLQILKELVSFNTVTPLGLECLKYIENSLKEIGFQVKILQYGPVHNLFAKYTGVCNTHICFAGHVDVVPPSKADWNHDPFNLNINGKSVSGVGVVDMKGAIACFIDAIKSNIKSVKSSVSIMLTTDEEGDAVDGLKKFIEEDFIKREKFDLFVLGEPTCSQYAGDAIKVGRRGSVTAILSIIGRRGHIAYPAFANSVVQPLSELIALLHNQTIGEDNRYFEKSMVQITDITTPNSAENVIPGRMDISFGIRFNSNYHSSEIVQILSQKIKIICDKYNVGFDITWKQHGEPFYITDENTMNWLSNHISNVTKIEPHFNTFGATSDGRFLTKLGPVVEIGLEENQAHQNNESTTIQNLVMLREIYSRIVLSFHDKNF